MSDEAHEYPTSRPSGVNPRSPLIKISVFGLLLTPLSLLFLGIDAVVVPDFRHDRRTWKGMILDPIQI